MRVHVRVIVGLLLFVISGFAVVTVASDPPTPRTIVQAACILLDHMIAPPHP
jgi:hypothetical protein